MEAQTRVTHREIIVRGGCCACHFICTRCCHGGSGDWTDPHDTSRHVTSGRALTQQPNKKPEVPRKQSMQKKQPQGGCTASRISANIRSLPAMERGIQGECPPRVGSGESCVAPCPVEGSAWGPQTHALL